MIEKLPIAETKGVGSVGCKVATILRGEADMYISLSGKTAPKDWDMAAPEIVLTAAGGMFTHADRRSLSYNKINFNQGGCLIATHGQKHEFICELVMQSIALIDDSFEV